MSIVDEASQSASRWQIQVLGYGLAAAGVAFGFAEIVRPGPLTAAALLLVAPLALLVAASAPEAFEVRPRVSKMLNPLLGVPTVFVLVMGLVHQLVDPTWAIVSGAIGAATFLALGYGARGRPGLQSPIAMMILLAVFGGLYGYGAAVLADVQFDTSPTTVIQVQVVDKFVGHDRSSTSYHLHLAPWGGRTATNEVQVSHAAYDKLAPGDMACIFQRQGALGLAWFTAHTCESTWSNSGR
jgi:hypothetical protein